jgi:hypothetical protein
MRSHAVDERAFSSTGRAGDADSVSAACVRKKFAENIFGVTIAIFDRRNGSRNRANVARADLLCPVFDRSRHRFRRTSLRLHTRSIAIATEEKSDAWYSRAVAETPEES